jgi:zona occludens toxin (predicted ATPase)
MPMSKLVTIGLPNLYRSMAHEGSKKYSSNKMRSPTYLMTQLRKLEINFSLSLTKKKEGAREIS